MKYYIKTFGCQMNEHDSATMESLLRREGHQKVASMTEADLVVINTCSVRDLSYQKAVSTIGCVAKGGRRPITAVTGCVASHEGAGLLKRFPFINLVLGPDHEAELPRLLRQINPARGPLVQTDFQDISDYEFPFVLEEARTAIAYLTIMKGCNNVCSFCIVPRVRGPEVSRPSKEILDEINLLTSRGVREVTLLGQNVNSYGKGLPEKTTFALLLRRIEKETTIDRIRFTSPHPKDLSNGLVGEYRRNERLCPHIHLPAQSGSNAVLRRMRRSYTRETFLRKVEGVRRAVPEIGLTTDLIVGFPGETERDFEQTLSLTREADFDAAYSFTFSPRPLTEAATLDDDVPPEAKKERLARLQEVQARISLEKNRSRIGIVEEVLVEGTSREGGRQLTGRTPHNRIVNFVGDQKKIGAILSVTITEASPYSLKGALQGTL